MRVDGELEPVSWSKALTTIGKKFRALLERHGKFGIVGSNHTTNEENYYLQKFARRVLATNNIDHHRTGDILTLLDAVSGNSNALATTRDLYEKKAILVIGADLALEVSSFGARSLLSAAPTRRSPPGPRP